MSENEVPQPPKRGRGRPRKVAPLPESAPEVDRVLQELTEVSAKADAAGDLDAYEDGFGLARTSREMANDLPAEEKPDFEFEPPTEKLIRLSKMAEELAAQADRTRRSNDGELLPNGDVELRIVLRELYAGALRQLADERGQTLTQAMQELVDWWVEQEYSTIQR